MYSTSLCRERETVSSFLFAFEKGGLRLPFIGIDSTFGLVRRSKRKAVLLAKNKQIANRMESMIFLIIAGPGAFQHTVNYSICQS